MRDQRKLRTTLLSQAHEGCADGEGFPRDRETLKWGGALATHGLRDDYEGDERATAWGVGNGIRVCSFKSGHDRSRSRAAPLRFQNGLGSHACWLASWCRRDLFSSFRLKSNGNLRPEGTCRAASFFKLFLFLVFTVKREWYKLPRKYANLAPTG